MPLDRVQKHKPLSDTAIKALRKANLIEGRKPNLFISKLLAQSTGKEIEYSKRKGFSDEFCCDLILKALNEHKSLSRSKINELVLDYLPAGRDLQNKIYKIGNLLAKLKRRQQIYLNCNKEWSLKK